MNWRRQRAGAENFAERRQRENDAPRLATVCPKLLTLKFALEEQRGGGTLSETTHNRPILVSRAPALFFFPCQDRTCTEGGHDLTLEIRAFLQAGKERMEGEDACRGQTGSSECRRVLRYVAHATYSA